jgi:DNA-binding NtrC family response regulator/tRNA A-37 threonylcarbamoyl transferase component Bud32
MRRDRVPSILLIDDDEDLTRCLGDDLRQRGHQVECLDRAERGPDLLGQGGYDVVLLDNTMPGLSGLEFLEAMQERGIRVPAILMTGFATTDVAIQAMNRGAFDYVVKPDDFDALGRELEPLIARAAEIARAMKERIRLPGQAAADRPAGPVLLGTSKPMLEVYKLIGRVARSAAAVLIRGETGTGKELVARAIHSNSPRKDKPFVVVDCNAPDESELDDELFGHEAGAFTGADKLRKGSFEHATGGTLFLDKVGDLPLGLQAKLLHVVEGQTVQRHGSRQKVPIDVRLLAASRRDLEADVRDGRVREDLFYRLQEVTIRLPPLRERGADLQLLAEHFALLAAEKTGRPARTLLDSAWGKLRGHGWPGNVRELQNTLHRAVLISQGPYIQPDDLEFGSTLPGSSHAGRDEPMATRAEDPAPAGEEEARAGLRQAIRWALRTGRSNPSPLLHDLLDQELHHLTPNPIGRGEAPSENGRCPDQFESIRWSGLLEPEQQEEVDRQLLPQFRTAQGRTVELQRRGWVTPWQVAQLAAGRRGELVLGPYVLLDLLGEGGMGQVFKARQRRLKRLTALKIIRPQHLNSASAVQRFQRETEAVARLAHPNIVQVYDADEVGGRCFLAMEFIDGTDLARVLKRQGPLPVVQACDFIRQAALGLQHAHECGLVHRDVKPSNLMLAPRGGLKILDLGLARLAPVAEQEPTADRLTQTGVVVGTPDYIAPEQALAAGTVDIRADLYSLGCTLYHCLTGQAPFVGSTLAQKLLQHQLEQPPPIETFRSDVPPALAEVVCRLMAKRPEDRYRTPAEVVAALDALDLPGPGAGTKS